MKTLEQVKQNKDSLITAANNGLIDKNEAKRKLRLINPVILYLEHQPSDASVKRQLEELVKRHQVIMREFDETFPRGCTPNIKSKWMKDKGVPSLKNQIRTIRYILSDREL